MNNIVPNELATHKCFDFYNGRGMSIWERTPLNTRTTHSHRNLVEVYF